MSKRLCETLLLLLLPCTGFFTTRLTAGELPLNVLSDNDSTYFEFNSNAFFRMDLFSPLQPTNQSLHDIDDPSIIFNQNFDGFPNDRNFRFGSVTFDESGLPGGTGQAPITALSLGIATNPADSSYINWRRFTTNTLVDSFSGAVDLENGLPVGLTLDVDLRLEVVNPLGSTMSGIYSGQFTIDDDRLEFQVEGHQTLVTFFGPTDVHLRWDFSGLLRSLATDVGDYDDDGDADGNDFLAWQRTVGNMVDPDGSGADGDGNGTVGAEDLDIWQDNFGSGLNAGIAPAGQAIAEPATLLPAAVGVAGWLGRRRGSRRRSACT